MLKFLTIVFLLTYICFLFIYLIIVLFDASKLIIHIFNVDFAIVLKKNCLFSVFSLFNLKLYFLYILINVSITVFICQLIDASKVIEEFGLFSCFFTHVSSIFFNGFLQTVALPQVHVSRYRGLIGLEFHDVNAVKKDVSVSFTFSVLGAAELG